MCPQKAGETPRSAAANTQAIAVATELQQREPACVLAQGRGKEGVQRETGAAGALCSSAATRGGAALEHALRLPTKRRGRTIDARGSRRRPKTSTNAGLDGRREECTPGARHDARHGAGSRTSGRAGRRGGGTLRHQKRQGFPKPHGQRHPPPKNTAASSDSDDADHVWGSVHYATALPSLNGREWGSPLCDSTPGDSPRRLRAARLALAADRRSFSRSRRRFTSRRARAAARGCTNTCTKSHNMGVLLPKCQLRAG